MVSAQISGSFLLHTSGEIGRIASGMLDCRREHVLQLACPLRFFISMPNLRRIKEDGFASEKAMGKGRQPSGTNCGRVES